MTSPVPVAVEEVLARLAKDVEAAVHAMYRREVGPTTAQVRTEHFVRDARDRLAAFLQSTAAPPVSGVHPRFKAVSAATALPAGSPDAGWSADEAAAVMKCIMGWLPIGSPTSAKPDTRCVAAGSQLLPTWAEREAARLALRKVPTHT